MSRKLHAMYRSTERVKMWLANRFTETGKLFLAAAAVAFLFGVNVQKTMIYQIFCALFILLLFSFIATLRGRFNVKIKRDLPENCVAGRELKYTITMENVGRKSLASIFFRESIEGCLPDWQEFVSSKEENEDQRNIFDRKMRYYRWLWLLRIGRRIESKDQELPELEPGNQQRAEMRLQPLQRGSIHLTGYTLTRLDPFGLCKFQIHHSSPCNLLVYPKLYTVGQLFFPGSRKYHQGGITAAQERGDSTEFLSLREYSHGDPIKHIDWKSTARSGRVIVKQYRDEYFSRYGLVLDSFTPKRHSIAFEEAVSVAASVLMGQDSQQSVLDLLFVGNECLTCTVGRGLADQQRFMKILASVATCRDRTFAELASLVKNHSPLLSGIVLILIDLDAERADLINYLVGNKIPLKPVLLFENREEMEAKKAQVTLNTVIREIDCRKVEEQLLQL